MAPSSSATWRTPGEARTQGGRCCRRASTATSHHGRILCSSSAEAAFPRSDGNCHLDLIANTPMVLATPPEIGAAEKQIRNGTAWAAAAPGEASWRQ
jgi:hypothetical protein